MGLHDSSKTPRVPSRSTARAPKSAQSKPSMLAGLVFDEELQPLCAADASEPEFLFPEQFDTDAAAQALLERQQALEVDRILAADNAALAALLDDTGELRREPLGSLCDIDDMVF
jgi:hypothetical protein